MQDYTLTTVAGSYVLTAASSTLVFTPADGTPAITLGLTGTPPVSPTDTEVDLVLSDGTTKKFVPA
jgi:hypothetical protein